MKHFKYPRTYHLPYSETVTDDDKRLVSDKDFFTFREVVVTVKMDGENSTCYPDGTMHARSIDGNKHEWQDWLKKYMQQWCYDIPDGFRVCGENLYPRHSIAYHFDNEKKFFQVFGIYDEQNNCISWDDTEFYCEQLGIEHVPVIYRGEYHKDAIFKAFNEYVRFSKDEVEGFVVRTANAFPYDCFDQCVGKYVRANHVKTDEHWTMHWKPNVVVG